MKLLGLVVENFRCFGRQEFDFTDQTVIRARNGKGKSSTAEAVVWCLYGTNIFGKTKADQSLIQEGTKSMRSLTNWQRENGEVVTIERIKPAKGVTQVLVNGNSATPGQIEGLFFPTVNEFLSVFIPGFFSSLEPKEAKAILARYSDVTPQEVMAQLLPKERDALEGIRFGMGYDSVEVFRKKVSDELKQAETEKLRLEGEVRATEDTLSAGRPQTPAILVTPDYLEKAEIRRQQLARVSVHAETNVDLLRKLTKQRDQLLVTLETVKATLMALEENCPTCGQVLSEQGRRKVTLKVHSHNTSIKKQINELEKQRDEANLEIARLEQPQTSGPSATEADITKWRDYVNRVDNALQRDRDAQSQFEAQLKLFEQAEENLKERKSWVMRQEQIILDLKTRLNAVKAFRFRYVKVQQTKLDSLFDKVHIVLSKANEDGELKDAFQIQWNKKPYQNLSTSEKVRCDLEIGRAIASLRSNPEPMPVFVDNAEGVQDLFKERLDRQTIAAYVFDSQLIVQAREEAENDLVAELQQLLDLVGDKPVRKGA